MRIESIKIKNFRTLQNVNVSFHGYFSSISGKNNAGKTSIIRSIRSIFKERDREFSFLEDDEVITYSNSRTQWAKEGDPIYFEYSLSIEKSSDPGIHSFIQKIANLDNLNDGFNIKVVIELKPEQERSIRIHVNDDELGKYETGEVFRRLSGSNIVIFHNSVSSQSKIFLPSGTVSFHEMILSKDEREELKKEQEKINRKVKKFAQGHRGELSDLLGKLEEKYEVELTVFEGMLRNTIPLGINLKDKGVEVPLDDWGSGTQNRTRIMMSILAASRIRQQTNDENRVTPIIVVEEPESFLHPSAQAEFGRVIRSLARDLGVQIIITTHSPYMLCQEQPASNILLDRKVFRNKLKETEVIDVAGEKWMEPFGKILGLDDDSVKPWVEVVQASRDNAVLVEGQIDKEYIEFISSLGIDGFRMPNHVEVIPYGGKDALKNSIMLKFVVEKFNRVYITFDLDAKNELEKTMKFLGMEEGHDYMAVGLNEDGKDSIEGLLPRRVHSAVYGENADLVMRLGSSDPSKRKSAKNEIKSKLLERFKKTPSLQAQDLKGFKELFKRINDAFK